MTKLDGTHIQLSIADKFPSETQVGHEQCGKNWDYRDRGREQSASQEKTNCSRSFPTSLEAFYLFIIVIIVLKKGHQEDSSTCPRIEN